MKIKTLKTNGAIRRECSSREFNIFYFYIFYSKFFRRETQTNDRTNARRRRATRASRVATPSIDLHNRRRLEAVRPGLWLLSESTVRYILAGTPCLGVQG